MKKAVIYARYSSERQTEQSIEGQLRVCKEFAEKNNIIILETYIDRAMTGRNDRRAAFQAMLRDSEKAPWDMVIVYALDRFGRNSIEVAVNKQRLKANNILLISATQRTADNIDGSKNLDGILLENVYIGLAEYYSAELSQKIKRGQNESRQKNQTIGGRTPYGYDVVDKKYVINQNEAEIVRGIFTDYANGKTAAVICQELENRGQKNKLGRPFRPSTIYHMLRLSQYIGIYKYQDEIFENTFPPIVDTGTYEKVQRIIERNKKAPSHRKSHGKFLLSGKLYCGECGSRMTGDSGTARNGTVHHYYKCNAKKRHHSCTMPSVQKNDIEDVVFNVCKDVLSNGFIPTIVDTAYNIQMDELNGNISIINLRDQLKEKEDSLNNILTALEAGIFTSSTKERLEELEKDIETIKGQIEIETARIQNIATKDDYTNFLKKFIDGQIENEEFKDALFCLLIRKVVLFRDKIRITFNFSPEKNNGIDETDVEASLVEISEAQEDYASIKSAIFDLLQANNPKKDESLCSDYSRLVELRGIAPRPRFARAPAP